VPLDHRGVQMSSGGTMSSQTSGATVTDEVDERVRWLSAAPGSLDIRSLCYDRHG
jgi:hypothetical protein